MSAPRRADSCRLAFVHDWLTGMRGGEKVLDVLCRRYPHADLFTLVHVRGSVSADIEQHRPVQSIVGRLPGVARYYRQCLPAFPAVVEHFNLDRYDLVVSLSHCAVKSVVTRPPTRHLCYCFTPMRYAWDQFEAYFGAGRLGWLSLPMRASLRRLARWDASTSGRPHRYLAISQYVARRIRRYYNRRSAVVFPPVDTEFFTPDTAPAEPFALVVSALVPYKRIDRAIDACRLAGMPLVIVGDGPEHARLQAVAGPDVRFTGSLSDRDVRDLYRRAAMVLLPGEEDFGLVPVEAQACGRPVVALNRGGACETVVHGVTGVLVADDSTEAFAAGIDRAAAVEWDVTRLRTNAERFSTTAFVAAIDAHLDDLLGAAPEAVRW